MGCFPSHIGSQSRTYWVSFVLNWTSSADTRTFESPPSVDADFVASEFLRRFSHARHVAHTCRPNFRISSVKRKVSHDKRNDEPGSAREKCASFVCAPCGISARSFKYTESGPFSLEVRTLITGPSFLIRRQPPSAPSPTVNGRRARTAMTGECSTQPAAKLVARHKSDASPLAAVEPGRAAGHASASLLPLRGKSRTPFGAANDASSAGARYWPTGAVSQWRTVVRARVRH